MSRIFSMKERIRMAVHLGPDQRPTILFIGERRSERAKELDVRWEDKALASKQLHDALEAAAYNGPIEFVNCLEAGASKVIASHEGPRVAMGKVAQDWLSKRGLVHVPMIHPAARGTIRRKENYAAHVIGVLQQCGVIRPVIAS